jgi:ATP-dependent DNA helicase DinG
LKKWAGRTKTGDRAELKDLPEDLGVWNDVCALSDTCLGQGCKFFERCFITRLRQEAAGSDVVIVNHHLFLADLAVRQKGYGEVLPRYEAVIFDEAHTLENVASKHIGLSISNAQLRWALHRLWNPRTEKGLLGTLRRGTAVKVVSELLDEGERFFSTVEAACDELHEKTKLRTGEEDSASKHGRSHNSSCCNSKELG